MTSVTLTGHVVYADDSDASGQVEIVPTTGFEDGLVSVVPVPRLVELVGGEFSEELYATDDADTLPVGATYTMVMRLFGGDADTDDPLRFELPGAASPVDLSDLL